MTKDQNPTNSDKKHAGGRPLKFKTVKDLKNRIDAYFTECDLEEDTRVYRHDKQFTWQSQQGKTEVRCKRCRGMILDEYNLPTTGCILVKGRLKEKHPYTVSGLALALGTTRQTLLEYEGEVEGREKKDPQFADAIKRAKGRCENYLEEKGLFGGMESAKAIFGLTNFKGWQNKHKHSVGGDPEAPPIQSESVQVVSYAGSAPKPPQPPRASEPKGVESDE